MAQLEEAVIPLEENWAISRYPDWSVDPIWIPSLQINLKNAQMSEIRMKTAFEILMKIYRLGENPIFKK